MKMRWRQLRAGYDKPAPTPLDWRCRINVFGHGSFERIEAENRRVLKAHLAKLRAAEEAEIEASGYFSELDWQEVVSPDGVRCFVTPRTIFRSPHSFAGDKDSRDSTHYLERDELAGLRRLARQGGYVFVNERGDPFKREGIARMIQRAGKQAGIPFAVHVHMLCHSCGHVLASKGVDTRITKCAHWASSLPPRPPPVCPASVGAKISQ